MRTPTRFLGLVVLGGAAVLMIALSSCSFLPMPEGWYDYFTRGAPTSFYDDCELVYNGFSSRYLYVPEAKVSTDWSMSGINSIILAPGESVQTTIHALEPTPFYFRTIFWNDVPRVRIDGSEVAVYYSRDYLYRVKYPAGEHTIQFSNINEWDLVYLDDLLLGSLPYIYITDTSQHRVIRIDDMYGSSYTSTWNSLSTPTDIELDRYGSIYIVDRDAHRIYRIDNMSGSDWEYFGSYGSGTDQFNAPGSIAIDSLERIYICDTGNNRIVRIDNMIGSEWTEFGTSGSGTMQFQGPTHIAIDHEDCIYIADPGNSRIVKINDMTGSGWEEFGIPGQSISICENGKLLIADKNNDRIIMLDDMSGSGRIELAGHEGDMLSMPSDVTMGIDGKIYIADTNNRRIVRTDNMMGEGWTTYSVGFWFWPSSVIYK